MKSLWFREIGGPSIFPTKVWGARPGCLVALAAALAILFVDQLWLRSPVPVSMLPSGPPPPPLHFAIDDVYLGPEVRLTRFTPTFEPSRAVEAANGLLYIAYAPDWPPPRWHQIGGESSRLGVLDKGRIALTKVPPDIRTLDIVGLLNGMPVVAVYDANGKTRIVSVGAHGLQPLSRLPTQLQYPPLCVPFAGGKICNEHELGLYSAVRITTRTGRSILVGGESYSYDVISYAQSTRLTRTVTEIGDVWLAGGGPHRFLLVEDQAGRGAAECLEGYAP